MTLMYNRNKFINKEISRLSDVSRCIRDQVELVFLLSAYPQAVEWAKRRKDGGSLLQNSSARIFVEVLRTLFLNELSERYPAFSFAWHQGQVWLNEDLLLSAHHWITVNCDRPIIIDPWGPWEFSVVDLGDGALQTHSRVSYRGLAVVEDTFREEEQHIYNRWKKKLRAVQGKWWYRQSLHSLDICLVGGILTGKRTSMQYLLRTVGSVGIDCSLIYRILAHRLLHQETFYPISPDFSLLRNCAYRPKELIRVKAGVGKRLGYLMKCLSEIDIAVFTQNSEQLSSNEISSSYYSSEVSELAQLIADLPSVQALIWDWIRGIHFPNRGKIILGGSYNGTEPASFIKVHLLVDENVAAKRLIAKDPSMSFDKALRLIQIRNGSDLVAQTEVTTQSMSRRVLIDTSQLSEQQIGRKILRSVISMSKNQASERQRQEKCQVRRESFSWPKNTLVEKLRQEGQHIINDVAGEYSTYAISPIELSIQTAIHMAAYSPDQVWEGYSKRLQPLHGALLEKSLNFFVDENSFSPLQSTLNKDLFRAEAKRQAQRILNLYESLGASCPFDLLKVVRRMGIGPEAGLKARGKLIIEDKLVKSSEELIYWAGRENDTGARILFKPVARNLSRIYLKTFHYLHDDREDEVAAFGAFLEGDEFPFALASYSPVKQGYNWTMLQALGIDPAGCLEFTRGWNCPWAPENTLSCLFAYSKERLKERLSPELSRYRTATSLQAILTSINPNLGFKAHAFRAVKYIPVGLKPATFTYLKDEEGNFTYLPRREIQRRLGLMDNKSLQEHSGFHVSLFPMAHTIKMLSFIERADEEAMLRKPLYVVPNYEYWV